jgi:hypothetical protein
MDEDLGIFAAGIAGVFLSIMLLYGAMQLTAGVVTRGFDKRSMYF